MLKYNTLLQFSHTTEQLLILMKCNKLKYFWKRFAFYAGLAESNGSLPPGG